MAGFANPYTPPPVPRQPTARRANPLGANPLAALNNPAMGSRYQAAPAPTGPPARTGPTYQQAPQGTSGGYGTVSASTQQRPSNVGTMAGAGPYNPAAAGMYAANDVVGEDIWTGPVQRRNQAAKAEYARANDFAERNSPTGQMRLRDEQDRKIRSELNQRAEVQERNQFLDSERLRAGARNEQVADRNAAMNQRAMESLLNAGAFGATTEASMGTDRRGLNLNALNAAGFGAGGMRPSGGGGLALPGRGGGGMSVGQQGESQTGDVGLATRIGETPADRYWTSKRANDLEGEQIALQNARTQQQWDAMDRSVYGGGGGGSRGSVRANASGGSGAGGSEAASFDPTLYNQMIQQLESGITAPGDVQMPDRPAAVEKLAPEPINDNPAFGRARSRIGQANSAAMRSLQDAMTARGISGSGIEGRLMTDLYGEGLGQVGEASRDAAIEQTRRDQDVADTNYAGALTQRGQDLGYVNSTLNARMQNQQASQQWALNRLNQRAQFAPLMLKNAQGGVLRY
jgi:hypothetical protein